MAKQPRADALKAAGRLEGLVADLGITAATPEVDPRGAAVTVAREGAARAMYYAHAEGDLTVASEAPIPTHSPLRRVLPTSPEALQLLGALTLRLESHATTANLLSDSTGLTGILLTRRLCGHAADSKAVDQAATELNDLAVSLASNLAESKDVPSLVRQFQPGLVIGTFQTVDERPPIIPTFDETQRDRMMSET
jgi:hypothetical protein